MRTRYELADAVRLFSSGLLEKGKLTPLQQKVLGKIASCRTAALGGHEECCNNGRTVRYSYNTCAIAIIVVVTGIVPNVRLQTGILD